jgi:hypothetical protein
MAESFWERAGEAAGYAIGAIIFGPYGAMIRRERRVIRGAFRDWTDEIDVERLRARSRGIGRRSGSLRGTEPIPFEVELDPFEKRAQVDVALALGRDVRALMSKVGKRVVLGGTNLDADTADELAHEVEASALGGLETFMLDLRKDRLTIDLPAPRDVESWKAIERGLVLLVESWTRRWTTYR